MICIKKTAAFTGAMLLFNIAGLILANATVNGNGTEVATNKTDTREVGETGSGLPLGWIVAAIVVTLCFAIGIYCIKQKADASGYASGNNIPKPLAGLSDDF